MLKKELRIRKQKEFDNIFKKGAYFSERFLALKTVENDLEISRFGFIVSNKISKKAVERNRIKRLLRETIRLRWNEIKPGFDVVFIFRGKEVKKSFDDVDIVVENLLKRSGLVVKKE
ncbi:MAG: ribonuclease P protein component [Candidatus Pacebacteria bacterium]|nr:ribonuclease P protein component [Candidatus Paceibacterota bacterium]